MMVFLNFQVLGGKCLRLLHFSLLLSQIVLPQQDKEHNFQLIFMEFFNLSKFFLFYRN